MNLFRRRPHGTLRKNEARRILTGKSKSRRALISTGLSARSGAIGAVEFVAQHAALLLLFRCLGFMRAPSSRASLVFGVYGRN